VRVGGGVSVIRQFLTADQIDEINLAVSPVFLGEGEHMRSKSESTGRMHGCTEDLVLDSAHDHKLKGLRG
jgi:dihydrofolate reductase